MKEKIEKKGLKRKKKKKKGILSKGYRKRVGHARAINPHPEVLILNKPTTGLEPNQIVEVRDLIKEVGKEKTVMLSTHIMQEVSAICERVIIINNGGIVADEKESSIVSFSNENQISIYAEYTELQNKEDLLKIRGAISIEQISEKEFLFSSIDDIRVEIFENCVSRNQKLLTLRKHEHSMDDVFRQLTHYIKMKV